MSNNEVVMPETNPTPGDSASGEDGAHEIVEETHTIEELKEKHATPPTLPMEWTQMGAEKSEQEKIQERIRYPSDVMDISNDPSETYLEAIGTAGLKITNMGKDLYRLVGPNLTHLIFRSHLIRKMEGLNGLKSLELLELYDNQIEYLEGLGLNDALMHEDVKENDVIRNDEGPGVNVKVMDMSYNMIREMKPVQSCPNLLELYLANNKLKHIEGIEHLTSLRKIDLGANRIRKIPARQFLNLTDLEELWLGKNKIEQIEGLEKLTSLKRLDVQSNRLTNVENLTGQVDTLEELYLAHNGITDEGAMRETGLLLSFAKLTTLDLSKNRLTSCRPFSHLVKLNELWISTNNISSFEDVQPISVLPELNEIYLEHNPIYHDFEYRKKLKGIVPSLRQIDANMIEPTRYGNMTTTVGADPNNMIQRMQQLQEKVVQKAKAQQEEKTKSEML